MPPNINPPKTSLPSFTILNNQTKNVKQNKLKHFNNAKSEEQSQLSNLDSSILKYPFKLICNATQNFKNNNFIGSGTFGKVYSGQLYGTEIAVKVLFAPKINDFLQEVSILSKYRHPNLVTLMGYSINENNFYLIFELLNSDLKSILKSTDLYWKKRLSIALDIAIGMSYLHNSQPKCFHRDLKSSNILITHSKIAKISDFGLSKLASPAHSYINFGSFSGTYGYADPAYIESGIFSESSEVYSFGIILLELLTSKNPAEILLDGSIYYLLNDINNNISNILEKIDLKAHFPLSIASNLSKLILECTNSNSKKRPNFIDISKYLRHLLSLNQDELDYQQPKQDYYNIYQQFDSDCISDEDMALKLSLQLSLESEKTQIHQYEEEKRDLLTALNLSKIEFEFEKLIKRNNI